jgi:ubiquinone biosynthesis protein UbiJ
MRLAAALFNRLLQRDQWARGQLAAHAGKVARIRCGVLRADFRIAEDGRLTSVAAVRPDTTLTVPPASMLDAPEFPDRAAMSIVVDGDPEAGGALVNVARVTPWLCESELARLAGPVAAQRFSSLVKAAVRVPRYAADRLGGNLRSYLREELDLAPRRSEFDRCVADLEAAVAQVDDLAARLERLSARDAR